MQPDISSIPQSLAQVFWLVLASSLGWIGGWLTRRKVQPHEIDKLRAETKSIHVTAETAEINLGRELIREMQAITDKAEQRREDWHQKEEQMRSQILFWRNKAEELDGKLADAQETMWKMQSEMETYEKQIKQMSATLTIKDTNYDNTKHLPIKPIDKPEE